jgi:hypothetical protein
MAAAGERALRSGMPRQPHACRAKRCKTRRDPAPERRRERRACAGPARPEPSAPFPQASRRIGLTRPCPACWRRRGAGTKFQPIARGSPSWTAFIRHGVSSIRAARIDPAAAAHPIGPRTPVPMGPIPVMVPVAVMPAIDVMAPITVAVMPAAVVPAPMMPMTPMPMPAPADELRPGCQLLDGGGRRRCNRRRRRDLA